MLATPDTMPVAALASDVSEPDERALDRLVRQDTPLTTAPAKLELLTDDPQETAVPIDASACWLAPIAVAPREVMDCWMPELMKSPSPPPVAVATKSFRRESVAPGPKI
jgi:hypothetical protein